MSVAVPFATEVNWHVWPDQHKTFTTDKSEIDHFTTASLAPPILTAAWMVSPSASKLTGDGLIVSDVTPFGTVGESHPTNRNKVTIRYLRMIAVLFINQSLAPVTNLLSRPE